ncbi:Protein BONZAI 1 [Porphyridium purpureum]|uniref:Protein BONZAI 1 n=1 Tax=Porphyridium purpureum TaxID=35688 RepID=A0A5J4Z1V6_PORPP|nr:Protein BONZAI 1 [Porphyridium purpureum]|eukprot:POR3430..scf208_2
MGNCFASEPAAGKSGPAATGKAKENSNIATNSAAPVGAQVNGTFGGKEAGTNAVQAKGSAQASSGQAVNAENDVQVEEATAQMFGKEVLHSTVLLTVSCRDLLDRDIVTKSDPMLVVVMNDVEVARSEVIKDNLNPDFVTPIQVVYRFEEAQPIQFYVYNVDTKYDQMDTRAIPLDEQDFLGSCKLLLAEIVGTHNMTKTIVMDPPPKKNGTMFKSKSKLIVRAEEVPEQNPQCRFQFVGHELDKKDLMGKSDPYFQIFRRVIEPSGKETRSLVYKSEARKQTFNPTWSMVTISMQRLCGNKRNEPLYIECYDWDRGGTHDFIGACSVSVDELSGIHKSGGTLDLMNLKKRGKDKRGGQIRVPVFETFAKPSFLEYIAGGCEVGFQVAIDFTASNGAVRDPRSLHHVQVGTLNPYMQAIISIGTVLEHYDTDKRFPVYGFGARLPWKNNDKFHCFSLKGDGDLADVEVCGVQGVLDAYMKTLASVNLSGPTYFSQVIEAASQVAQEQVTQHKQRYHILMILTDGIIDDMNKTIEAIIAASSLPMSIIIVGIGSANFGNMDVLDGDQKLLGSKQTGYASRDIVQFVPMRDFLLPNSVEIEQVRFCRALLEEVPAQVIRFFDQQGIKPNPPVRSGPSATTVENASGPALHNLQDFKESIDPSRFGLDQAHPGGIGGGGGGGAGGVSQGLASSSHSFHAAQFQDPSVVDPTHAAAYTQPPVAFSQAPPPGAVIYQATPPPGAVGYQGAPQHGNQPGQPQLPYMQTPSGYIPVQQQSFGAPPPGVEFVPPPGYGAPMNQQMYVGGGMQPYAMPQQRGPDPPPDYPT